MTTVTESSATAAQPETPAELPIAGSIEAILLSTDRPVPAMRLALAVGIIKPPKSKANAPAEGDEVIEDPASDPKSEEAVASAIATLNADYESTGRSFRIELLAGGYRVMTRPEFATALATFHRQKVTSKLSRAAVESLAIIAYKQPLTRAALEGIRGVACGEVLRSLMDRRLITIKGRAEELGRPMLYGTTKAFLDRFGLASIKDLPTIAELRPNP